MNRFATSFLMLMLLTNQNSFATEYKFETTCGKVQKVSGSKCDQLSVEFSFDNCPQKIQRNMVVDKLKCEDSLAKAEISIGSYKYVAELKKSSSGWDTQWVASNGLKVWKRQEAAGVKVAKKKTHQPQKEAALPQPTIEAQASTPEVAAQSQQMSAPRDVASDSKASSPLKISGFAEAAYNWEENNDVGSGFTVADAALYVEHGDENMKLFVDLPFANNGEGNDFKFAKSQGQAYITINDLPVEVTFGQFDTIYGFELNDSKDRAFIKPGIVFASTLPTSHTGLMLSKTIGVFGVKLLTSNQANNGQQNDASSEYGIQTSLTFDNFYATFNYLTYSQSHLESDKDRQFYNLVTGVSLGFYQLDIELGVVDNDAAWTYKTANAIMLHNTIQINDNNAAHLRLENTTKFKKVDPDPDKEDGYFSQAQASIGYSHTHKNILFRSDYTWNQAQSVDGGDKENSSQIHFSALYSF